MTLQSLRKLRTTLRKTFSNKTTSQTLCNGMMSAAILFGAACAIGLSTMDRANAQSWQGRNSQQIAAHPSAAVSAVAETVAVNQNFNATQVQDASNGYVEPVVMPITMDRTEVKPAIYNQIPGEGSGIQLVGYSAQDAPKQVNQSLKWGAASQSTQIYRAARQPQLSVSNNPNGYVQQVSGEALSDPFGDRRAVRPSYGTPTRNMGNVPATTAPVTMPVPGIAPETENPPTLPNTDVSVPNVPNLDGSAPLPTDTVPSLDGNAPTLDAGIPTEPEAPSLEPINPGAELAPNLEGLDAPAPTALENGQTVAPNQTNPIVAPSQSSQNRAGNQIVRPNQNLLNTFRAPGTSDDNLARARKMEEKCPPVSSLKPISKITNDIAPTPGEFPNECTLGDEVFGGRSFAPIRYTWTAPNTCNNPLYFEEAAVERYGHCWGPVMQPLVSAGHFILTVPCLPWLMAIDPPNECVYTLGYYRPGDCAPYMFDPLPYSVRAAVVEGGVATALVFLIP